MSLREDLLPSVLSIRSLTDPSTGLGVHTNRVWVRTRTWSEGEVGLGMPTDVDVEIVPRPHVEHLGVNKLKLTHITPLTTGGGYAPADLQPTLGAGQESMIVVNDPDGTRRMYTILKIHTERPFSYALEIEGLDRAVPY